MANLPEIQRRRMILLFFSLCLGSLVICEVIDPLMGSVNNWEISFTEGLIQLTHLDEHDDDYVLTEQVVGNIVPGIIDQDGSSLLRGASCFLSPLSPPPKAS